MLLCGLLGWRRARTTNDKNIPSSHKEHAALTRPPGPSRTVILAHHEAGPGGCTTAKGSPKKSSAPNHNKDFAGHPHPPTHFLWPWQQSILGDCHFGLLRLLPSSYCLGAHNGINSATSPGGMSPWTTMPNHRWCSFTWSNPNATNLVVGRMSFWGPRTTLSAQLRPSSHTCLGEITARVRISSSTIPLQRGLFVGSGPFWSP